MPGGRNWVRGEYLAQLDNRDPFAPPVWRSPVYRTPEAVILVRAQPRPPVLADVHADAPGRSSAAFHAAASLTSWPGRPRLGARIPVALSE